MDYETAALIHRHEMDIEEVGDPCLECGKHHPSTENCAWYDEHQPDPNRLWHTDHQDE